jgi:hypothetical protein
MGRGILICSFNNFFKCAVLHFLISTLLTHFLSTGHIRRGRKKSVAIVKSDEKLIIEVKELVIIRFFMAQKIHHFNVYI